MHSLKFYDDRKEKFIIKIDSMLLNKIFGKALFCASKQVTPKIPKAPKFERGELEYFKYDFQNAKIFDGYTLDELYGSKVGPKNPPAIEAEMKKDTIASLVLFGIGVGIIYHLNWLFSQEYSAIKSVQQGKLKKEVQLPQHAVNSFR